MNIVDIREPYVERSTRIALNGLQLTNGRLFDYIELPSTQIELEGQGMQLGDTLQVDYLQT